MKVLRTSVVLALVALVASACGSGHNVEFSTFSQAGGLSVPVPPGFHHRSWGQGVAISDGAIGPGGSSAPLTAGYLPQNPSQVALSVVQGVFHGPTPAKDLPVTLHDLGRASGGLTLWGGAFLIRDRQYGFEVWLGRHASGADRSAVLSALQAVKLR